MKPSDDEIRTAMQDLGRQVEGKVPPSLYQVAQLVSTANAREQRAPRRGVRKALEIAAACVLLGSIVGMAAYRNLYPAGITAKLNPDECGYRDAILDNLRLAAQGLPLPATIISMREESREDGIRQASYWAESGEPYFRQQQEQGRLAFRVVGGQAILSTWSGESMKDPGLGFTSYRFPPGGLAQSANIPDILKQLGVAAGEGQARVTTARTMIPKISREEYYRTKALDRYSWTLKDLLRWYEANAMGAACVARTVPIYENGPISEVNLPMIQLIPGKYVGFHGEHVVTFAEGEGLYGGGAETTWYPVPGLRPTSGSTGTPIPKPKRDPADQARRQERFDKLKAEVEREEAKLAALKIPSLEEVGEAAYTKAAEENARQGARVKDLHIELAQAYQELIDPITDEVRLEKEIDRARALLMSPGYEAKHEQRAKLDQIEREFRAGTKPAQALLKEVEAVLHP